MKICGIYFSNLLNSVGTGVYTYVFNWKFSYSDIEKMKDIYCTKNFNALWFNDEVETFESKNEKKDARFDIVSNYFGEIPYSIVLFKDGYFIATDLMYTSYTSLLLGLVNLCRDAKKEYKFETISPQDIKTSTDNKQSSTSLSTNDKYNITIANYELLKKDTSLIRGWIYSKKYEMTNDTLTSLFDEKLDLSSDDFRAADLLKMDIIAYRRFLSFNGKIYDEYTIYESMCMLILMTHHNFNKNLFDSIQPYIIPRSSNTKYTSFSIKDDNLDKISFVNDKYLVYHTVDEVQCINMNNPEEKTTIDFKQYNGKIFRIKEQNILCDIVREDKGNFLYESDRVNIWLWRLDQIKVDKNGKRKIIPSLLNIGKNTDAVLMETCSEGLIFWNEDSLYLAKTDIKSGEREVQPVIGETKSSEIEIQLPVLSETKSEKKNLSSEEKEGKEEKKSDTDPGYNIEKLKLTFLYKRIAGILINVVGKFIYVRDGGYRFLINLNNSTQLLDKDYQIQRAFSDYIYLYDENLYINNGKSNTQLLRSSRLINFPTIHGNYVCRKDEEKLRKYQIYRFVETKQSRKFLGKVFSFFFLRNLMWHLARTNSNRILIQIIEQIYPLTLFIR